MLHILAVLKHKVYVCYFLAIFSAKLFWRALFHDLSKFSRIERTGFSKASQKMHKVAYGSEEYEHLRKTEEMKLASAHHHRVNRHHPEHFHDFHALGGVTGMTLVDLVEMWCDWQSAVKRQEGGSLHRSVQVNKEGFGISDQLAQILRNSI